MLNILVIKLLCKIEPNVYKKMTTNIDNLNIFEIV